MVVTVIDRDGVLLREETYRPFSSAAKACVRLVLERDMHYVAQVKEAINFRDATNGAKLAG